MVLTILWAKALTRVFLNWAIRGDAVQGKRAHMIPEFEFTYLVRRPAHGVALAHAANTVITVRVPTGKLEDVGFVGVGTAAATLGATAFILFEIFVRQKREPSKRGKTIKNV